MVKLVFVLSVVLLDLIFTSCVLLEYYNAATLEVPGMSHDFAVDDNFSTSSDRSIYRCVYLQLTVYVVSCVTNDI